MIRKRVSKGKLDKGYICMHSRGMGGGQHDMPREQTLVDVEIKRGYYKKRKPLILASVY